MIEQKSSGVPLDKKILQSDGIYLTPYEQAKRYNDNLPLSEKARWIIVSNFSELWVYDMDTTIPENSVAKLYIVDLLKNNSLFNFILLENRTIVEGDTINSSSILNDDIILSSELARALLYSQSVEPWTILSQKMFACILAEIDQEWYRNQNDNIVSLNNIAIAKQMQWDLEPKDATRVIKKIMQVLLTKNITISNYSGPIFLKFSVKNNITHVEINPEFMPHLILEALKIFNKSFFEIYKSDILNFSTKGSFSLYLDLCCSSKNYNGVNFRSLKLEHLKKLLGMKKDAYTESSKKDKNIKNFKRRQFEKFSLNLIVSDINNSKKIKLIPYEDENLFKINRAVKSVFEYEFKYIITN